MFNTTPHQVGFLIPFKVAAKHTHGFHRGKGTYTAQAKAACRSAFLLLPSPGREPTGTGWPRARFVPSEVPRLPSEHSSSSSHALRTGCFFFSVGNIYCSQSLAQARVLRPCHVLFSEFSCLCATIPVRHDVMKSEGFCTYIALFLKASRCLYRENKRLLIYAVL